MLEELSKAVSEIGEHIREREKELDREFIYQTLPDDCWLELREGSQAILRVLLRRESSKHVIRGRSKVRSDQISGLLEDLEKKGLLEKTVSNNNVEKWRLSNKGQVRVVERVVGIPEKIIMVLTEDAVEKFIPNGHQSYLEDK